MKKKILPFLITILALCTCMFTLTACGGKVEFKINFVVEGEVYATINTSGDEIIRMPENPVKEDYTFDGWFWDKDVWEKPFTANSLLDAPLSSNMSVYAKFSHVHVCAFTEEVAINNYIATNATCEDKATYYYSCTCGEKGTETFESGEPLGHSFTNYVYNNDATCEEDGTETALCDRDNCNETHIRKKANTAGHNWQTGNCLVCNETQLLLKLSSNGMFYIVKDIGSFLGEELTIPNTYNNLPVKEIGERAFYNCGSLKSITISNNVTSIGSSAFEGCSNLTNIIMGNGITEVGNIAFYGCDKLRKVNYAGTIDDWANIEFAFCSSNPVYYAKNLYINGVDALEGAITINASKVGANTFYDCSKLTSIIIGENVKSIGKDAFSKCSAEIVWGGNPSVKSIDDHAFYGYKGTIITIPNSVKSIGDYAFYGCMSLTSVVIGDNVTSIGKYAFSHCFGLTNIKYRGSSSQWSEIVKISDWDYGTGSYTITYNYAGE